MSVPLAANICNIWLVFEAAIVDRYVASGALIDIVC
jgi:hypothetical protein